MKTQEKKQWKEDLMEVLIEDEMNSIKGGEEEEETEYKDFIVIYINGRRLIIRRL